MLPSKVVLELSPGEFAYLLRTVERDIADAQEILLVEDCDSTQDELGHAVRMQRLLQRVEQAQVYTH
jgi:hypothetical protein